MTTQPLNDNAQSDVLEVLAVHDDPPLPYSVEEEIANSITHGIGMVLSVAGLTALVMLGVLYGTVTKVVSFSIFGGTMVAVYLSSTLYHSVFHVPAKRVLQIVDHSAILLLIAGTYTPFMLLGTQSGYGTLVLTLVWLLATFGICCNLFFWRRWRPYSLYLYLGMGWLGVVVAPEVAQCLSPTSLNLLIAGGLTYTAGVIFFLWKSLRFHHTIWHLFVLGGSVCHFIAVLQFVYA